MELKDLPDWPTRMKAQTAAAYMDVSISTFLARFRAIGIKEGGNTFWARSQLDEYVAAQFGLPRPGTPGQQLTAYDKWKNGR